MTTEQVPGQLELPIEFNDPITVTVEYVETTFETEVVTVELTVPANYKPLIDLMKDDPHTYPLTFTELLSGKQEDQGIFAPIVNREFTFDDQISKSHFRIL